MFMLRRSIEGQAVPQFTCSVTSSQAHLVLRVGGQVHSSCTSSGLVPSPSSPSASLPLLQDTPHHHSQRPGDGEKATWIPGHLKGASCVSSHLLPSTFIFPPCLPALLTSSPAPDRSNRNQLFVLHLRLHMVTSLS
jgi:hypothetical protein